MRRNRVLVAGALFLATAWAVGTGGPPAAVGAKASGPPGRPKPRRQQPVKYRPATQKEIEANRARAVEWARKTRDSIAGAMHLVETRHFLIFSAWDRSNDKPLADICEKMYEALRVQFDLPPRTNIWAGKCPVYIFWEKEHYVRFTTEIDKVGQEKAEMTRAAGYNSQGGGFTYIVMNHTRDRTWFYEVLVHEATHAFLGRYLTNRDVPTWVNEGLADYMAATLVKGSWAQRKYLTATKEALLGKKDIMPIFKDVGSSPYEYGIAQSLVRYLLARDRKGFVKFITLMKRGTPEEDALIESFGIKHWELARDWRQAAAKAYHRL